MINMMIYAYGLTSFLPDHDIWWQYIFLLQTIIFTLNFLNYSIASSNLKYCFCYSLFSTLKY